MWGGSPHSRTSTPLPSAEASLQTALPLGPGCLSSACCFVLLVPGRPQKAAALRPVPPLLGLVVGGIPLGLPGARLRVVTAPGGCPRPPVFRARGWISHRPCRFENRPHEGPPDSCPPSLPGPWVRGAHAVGRPWCSQSPKPAGWPLLGRRSPQRETQDSLARVSPKDSFWEAPFFLPLCSGAQTLRAPQPPLLVVCLLGKVGSVETLAVLFPAEAGAHSRSSKGYLLADERTDC